MSSLFLDYDDDDDKIYDLDDEKLRMFAPEAALHKSKQNEHDHIFAENAVQIKQYDSPADLCHVADNDEITCVAAEGIKKFEIAQTSAGMAESSICFEVPEGAMSSCVWIGSSLLSRMLFQIYNEMGDESKTNTW